MGTGRVAEYEAERAKYISHASVNHSVIAPNGEYDMHVAVGVAGLSASSV